MKKFIYSIGIFLFPFLAFGQWIQSFGGSYGEEGFFITEMSNGDLLVSGNTLSYNYDGSIERIFIKE